MLDLSEGRSHDTSERTSCTSTRLDNPGLLGLMVKADVHVSVSRVTTMLRVAAVNVDEAAARVYMGVEFDKNM